LSKGRIADRFGGMRFESPARAELEEDASSPMRFVPKS
jgi:hypothetical protein